MRGTERVISPAHCPRGVAGCPRRRGSRRRRSGSGSGEGLPHRALLLKIQLLNCIFAEYNAVITRSKSHRIWQPGCLEQAFPILLPSDTLPAESSNYELRDGALTGDNTKQLFDHVWIDPTRLGRGNGRRTLDRYCTGTRRAVLDGRP